MDFANDLLAGLRSRVQPRPGGAQSRGIDWSALHARFAAAHAARAQLVVLESPRGAIAGGFSRLREPAFAGGHTLPAVNPTDSADGKAQRAMVTRAPEIPLPAAEDNND